MKITVFVLIPIVFSIGILPVLPFSYSEELVCPSNEVEVVRITNPNSICIDQNTAQKWTQLGIAEIVGEPIEDEMIEDLMEEDVVGDNMEEQLISSSIMIYTQESPTIDPQKGYFVIEIGDGLYWLMDGTYQVMFLTTGEGVIVIDAPPSLGQKYLQAISEVTDEPITHLIYSHTHNDHVGAAGMFSDASVIIAQKQAAEHLVAKNDPNRPIPTISFDDTFTLELGTQTLELYYIGNYHSKGDIIIYAPSQKVAMIVDYFHPGGAPFKNFGITQDMGVHIATFDILLEMFDDDVIFVSGHETILGTKQHISEYKQFTNDVLNNSFAALEKISFEEIAQQQGPDADGYAMFDAYLDALAVSCAQDTIEQWDGKLNGLETFMEDNCLTMTLYATLD